MTLPLKVEYERDVANEWRFRVRAGNHEIICQGEGYKELRSAQHAVAVLSRGLPSATTVVLPDPFLNALARALTTGEAMPAAANALAPRPATRSPTPR